MIHRASSLKRMELCPGSVKATAGLYSPDSTDSISGRKVHEALALIWRKGQPKYQKVEEVCEELGLTQREEVIASWFTSKLKAEVDKRGGVLETWAEIPMRRENLVGTCDLVVHCCNDDWIVLDWKTGELEVETADRNIQLTAYACMGRQRFGYSRAHLFLFSAGNEDGEQFTATTLHGSQFDPAWEFICDVMRKAEADDAKRRPCLNACRYCPALGNAERCPEGVAIGLGIVEETKAELVQVRDPKSALRPLDPKALARIAHLYDQLKLAARLKESVEGELKKRLAGGEDMGGHFRLTEPKERRWITDAEKAYNDLVVTRMLCSHDDFMSIVNVTVGKLQSMLKPALKENGVLVKDHKNWLDTVMSDGGYMEKKAMAPSLERITQDPQQLEG